MAVTLKPDDIPGEGGDAKLHYLLTEMRSANVQTAEHLARIIDDALYVARTTIPDLTDTVISG